MRVPSHNGITLQFGATTDPYTPSAPHRGTDFSYLPDDTIYAPFAGRVVQMPSNGNDGNGTYITEPNGRFHGMLHASKYLVPNNTQVQEGQAIAVMGSTGYAFGKHLHWCVKENGVFIDPMGLITKGDEMIPTRDLLNALFRNFRGREASDEEAKKYVNNISYNDLVPILDTGDEHNAYVDNSRLGQKAKAENWEGSIKDLTHKLEIAQVVNGDSTKWQNLKTLIKELIS